MASLRIVQQARAGQLYRDVTVRFAGGQVFVEKADGSDLARVSLSLEEQYAIDDQLPTRPRPDPRPAFEVGLDAPPGWVARIQTAVGLVKPSFVRLEASPGAAQALDTSVKAAGSARPLVLVADWQALTVKDVDGLTAWPSMRHLELGNEDSYTYKSGEPSSVGYRAKARAYALKAKEIAGALPPGIGLLVQADDGNTGSSVWVDEMFAAVPDLHTRIAGWTIHPYGPGYLTRLGRLVTQTSRHGAPQDMPIHVTEWGLATADGKTLSDNYGWDRAMTYRQAGETITTVVGRIRQAFPQVASFSVFQAVDSKVSTTDREGNFGVLRQDGTAKGAYTDAVARLA